jgi:hypothetical protein
MTMMTTTTMMMMMMMMMIMIMIIMMMMMIIIIITAVCLRRHSMVTRTEKVKCGTLYRDDEKCFNFVLSTCRNDVKTRQVMYVESNFEARSCKHCCSVKQ